MSCASCVFDLCENNQDERLHHSINKCSSKKGLAVQILKWKLDERELPRRANFLFACCFFTGDGKDNENDKAECTTGILSIVNNIIKHILDVEIVNSSWNDSSKRWRRKHRTGVDLEPGADSFAPSTRERTGGIFSRKRTESHQSSKSSYSSINSDDG